MKVSWDDDIPNRWENKSHVPNHQAALTVNDFVNDFSHFSPRILTPDLLSVSFIWTCAGVDKKFRAEHCLVWLHIETLHGLEDLPMQYQK